MFTTEKEFEDEVRRIARLLWPTAEFGGAQLIDSRERDGIFESEDFVHCVECTISRRRDKAAEDGAKLDKLIKRLSVKHPTKFLKGWFITLEEPTADQRAEIAKYSGRVVAASYDQFRAKLVDARSYLTFREKYPFGSVRDPKTDASDFRLDYFPLDILDQGQHALSVDALVQDLEQGNRLILTGDYGAGKSSTAREIFFGLAKFFWKGKTAIFPLFLNLRDHHGQVDPVEALERHARNVGFPSPASLVRGWRAGYCILILDGFDEIASAGWAGITKRLRDLRYRSMELVRRFIRDSPSGCGILVTGRAHFFDSQREMIDALGAGGRFSHAQLTELSEHQVESFLDKFGWKDRIPEWLPTRPLLLAYLVARGFLGDATNATVAASPAVGWHELLERISEREAGIEAGIDPGTVRRLIEALATEARSSVDGLGPLSPDRITTVFKKICGYPPDDRGAVLLQRLPGLGGVSSEDGSRVFVDSDYAEAARSGDVFHFIEDPHNSNVDSEDWQSALRNLGASITAYRCQLARYEAGKISSAVQVAHSAGRADTLCVDLLLSLSQIPAKYQGKKLYVKEVVIEELLLDDPDVDLGAVEFQDCIIINAELGVAVEVSRLPTFRHCQFARLEGRAGERDLPRERFVECTFEEFEHKASTTNSILELALPLRTKVLLTALKKIYAQSGTGRKESALFRGLDHRAQQVVPDVLDLLRRHGFAIRSRQGSDVVWLPGKTGGVRRRALAALAAPTGSTDPLVEESKRLD